MKKMNKVISEFGIYYEQKVNVPQKVKKEWVKRGIVNEFLYL